MNSVTPSASSSSRECSIVLSPLSLSMIGGRAAKKPNVDGYDSRISAACSFTGRASREAASPLRIDVLGAVRDRIAVAMKWSCIIALLLSTDQGGRAGPDG